MAHPVQQNWCIEIKNLYPQYFINKKVIDIGSLDINGNNKHLFTNCRYIGVDVIKGNNVDIISTAHEVTFENESFDVVLSTNALEHDMYYQLTLKKMVELLKPNGLLFFSAACKWKEHGTTATSPSDSGTTQMGSQWASYYKNINEQDIEHNIDKTLFKEYHITIYEHDNRFVGIKNDG